MYSYISMPVAILLSRATVFVASIAQLFASLSLFIGNRSIIRAETNQQPRGGNVKWKSYVRRVYNPAMETRHRVFVNI